jgi:hypothetical protein
MAWRFSVFDQRLDMMLQGPRRIARLLSEAMRQTYLWVKESLFVLVY